MNLKTKKIVGIQITYPPNAKFKEVHLGTIYSSGGGATTGSGVSYATYVNTAITYRTKSTNTSVWANGRGHGRGSLSDYQTTNAAGAIISSPPIDKTQCPGYLKNDFGNCVENCRQGKTYNKTTKKCECTDPNKAEDINGNCVEVDKIITDNLKNPCVENILKELQQKDSRNYIVPDLTGVSHLSQTILNLFDTSTNYNLTFEIKQLGFTRTGEKNAETVNVNGGWKITLDTDLAKKGTQLFIAKTLIHESMHAFINYSLKTNKTSDLATDLNTLYQKYKNQGNFDKVANNLSQHEFISQYIEALSHSLAAYDNHKQSDDYYKMLSWGGLESSTVYSSLTNKKEIQKAINNERYGKSNAKGKKCD